MSSEATPDLLHKAGRSLEAAERLLTDGFFDFAASRSYYAMFYATQALLLSRDLSFSKHSAAIAAFGRHFVKTGVLDPCLHRYLLDAFDLRNLGDYGAAGEVDEASARQVLDNARTFCAVVRSHLAAV